MNNELTELNCAVDDFAVAMKAKLAVKMREGMSGWDSPYMVPEIASQISQRANLVQHDSEQAVDVANLAMMLWYQASQAVAV